MLGFGRRAAGRTRIAFRKVVRSLMDTPVFLNNWPNSLPFMKGPTTKVNLMAMACTGNWAGKSGNPKSDYRLSPETGSSFGSWHPRMVVVTPCMWLEHGIRIAIGEGKQDSCWLVRPLPGHSPVQIISITFQDRQNQWGTVFRWCNVQARQIIWFYKKKPNMLNSSGLQDLTGVPCHHDPVLGLNGRVHSSSWELMKNGTGPTKSNPWFQYLDHRCFLSNIIRRCMSPSSKEVGKILSAMQFKNTQWALSSPSWQWTARLYQWETLAINTSLVPSPISGTINLSLHHLQPHPCSHLTLVPGEQGPHEWN